jgi:hypothetical protein
MQSDSYKTCEYHSAYWNELVESGWITVSVANGIALMLFDGRKR